MSKVLQIDDYREDEKNPLFNYVMDERFRLLTYVQNVATDVMKYEALLTEIFNVRNGYQLSYREYDSTKDAIHAADKARKNLCKRIRWLDYRYFRDKGEYLFEKQGVYKDKELINVFIEMAESLLL